MLGNGSQGECVLPFLSVCPSSFVKLAVRAKIITQGTELNFKMNVQQNLPIVDCNRTKNFVY